MTTQVSRVIERERRALRVGIVNIMPRAETYEPLLLTALQSSPVAVRPVWIRLRSHGYSSSDMEHIQRRYVTFDDAMSRPLDGLLLTGAPVEEIPFEQVHYWPELVDVLTTARANVTSTLGLCWGGLALAKLLGLQKVTYPKKVFGVFHNRPLTSDHALLSGADGGFWCAHSRHAGLADADLERAANEGVVRLLAHGPETGYSMFETSDRRYVAHLGHPEYEPARLALEWERDRRAGRVDVGPPQNFDLADPKHVWRAHREHLFGRWLHGLGGSRSSSSLAADR